jgi:2-polyprenyl-3-methyl-5-hydroxy-6-metoxy-1,4-benzoquinol methylase
MNKKTTSEDRLRASPSFALSFAMDGRPFVAKETEPYIQYWLTERDRVLLSLFSSRVGATADDAMQAYLRLTGTAPSEAENKRMRKAIDAMHHAGLLMSAHDDVSRYSARIVDAYVAHRPFPRELSDQIIQDGSISTTSRVLDLAGGPGDLALALAQVSAHVSLMELSKGFVNAATRRARQQGLQLATIHDSCNRLIYDDAQYDAVTISQALHWLDDVLVCRGLCRCVSPGGSFFVIQGAFSVDDQHPLSYLFGPKSILGHASKLSFAKQAAALQKRLTLLFEALDSPEVQRIDPAQRFNRTNALVDSRIVPTKASLFRQRRPMGVGYARAFLTPAHIAVTGQSPVDFWAQLEARCAGATDAQLEGNYDWSLMQFQRGGKPVRLASLEKSAVLDIGYQPPPKALTKATVT